MKEVLHQWLRKRPRTRGVLAWGVRFPDKNSLTQSWSPEFAAASMDNAWRCASDAFEVLRVNFLPDHRVRWVYEKAILYCTRREDGICLGIFTANRPDALDVSEIEGLIAEFRTLRADGANATGSHGISPKTAHRPTKQQAP